MNIPPCTACQNPLTVGYDSELFCANPRCPFQLRDQRTGDTVKDHRYRLFDRPEDDPERLRELGRFLVSEDYMERLGAIKQLEAMTNDESVDLLNQAIANLDASKPLPSTATFMIEVLSLRRDVRARAGLQRASEYLRRQLAGNGNDAEQLDMVRQGLEFVQTGLAKLEGSDASLWDAVRLRDVDAAKRFLASGADVQGRGSQDATPLHWAAVGGSAELTQLLLDAGAEPDVKDALSWTPLTLAADGRSYTVTKVLLEGGADPNLTRDGDITALHLAVVRVAPRIVETLLRFGAKTNLRDQQGRIPLEYAQGNGLTEIAELLGG